ncbi:MAG TPA: DUF937 domain-containing protein [Patescibacteria group bacterium]|nr:DUF937 domain-containing protein [Patescibacteria group bacterium]
MNDLLNGLLGGTTPQITNQISSQFGIDQNIASQLIPAIAPLILGGLKRQAQTGGEQRVDHILNKYGNEGVFNNISGTIQQQALNSNPDPNLGGLLGGQGTQAAQVLSSKFGIDVNTAMKLIPIIAPFILGALSKQRNSAPAQGGEAKSGGIMDFLDRNGDGSVLDDVMGFLGSGNRTGGSQQQSNGGLGGMLGNILGGGR